MNDSIIENVLECVAFHGNNPPTSSIRYFRPSSGKRGFSSKSIWVAGQPAPLTVDETNETTMAVVPSRPTCYMTRRYQAPLGKVTPKSFAKKGFLLALSYCYDWPLIFSNYSMLSVEAMCPVLSGRCHRPITRALPVNLLALLRPPFSDWLASKHKQAYQPKHEIVNLHQPRKLISISS